MMEGDIDFFIRLEGAVFGTLSQTKFFHIPQPLLTNYNHGIGVMQIEICITETFGLDSHASALAGLE